MKTKLFAWAILLAGMQSCSQDEVLTTETQTKSNSIAFSTYAMTKGASINSNGDFATNGRSFGVSAFISTEGVNDPYLGGSSVGTQITKGDSKWGYFTSTDMRYWPTSTETLDFYAYTPFTDENRNATIAFSKTTGMTFTDYTVPTVEANQQDFMYARALTQTKPSESNAVTMKFYHALTQVGFTAQTVSSNLYVDIEGITLNNIHTKGVFNLSSVSGETNDKAKWSTPSELGSYAATIDGKNNTEIGTDIKTLTTADKALILMPQTTTAWTKEANVKTQDNSYLAISCKIYTKLGVSKVYLHGTSDAYATVYLPLAASWEKGKRITYNLKFGGGYDADGKPILNPIEFTTDVENWVDETADLDL